MPRKKHSLPFDNRGGVIAMQKRMVSSGQFLKLTAQAKALALLMQAQWRPNAPVGFGIRQAMREIPCSKATAMRTFSELQEAGFIKLIDESLFCSREQSKTRTWRLTWLPCWMHRPPTNDWETTQ